MADTPKFRDEDASDPGIASLTPKKSEDVRDDAAYPFLARLEGMIEDPRYAFAKETLEGIYIGVDARKRMTEGQLRAVDNIERSVEGRENRRQRYDSVVYRRY